MNMIWKVSLMIVAIIISDQITKGLVQQNFFLGESIPIIDGFFNFTYVRNPGAAWGMGGDFPEIARKLLFLFLPVVACLWLVYLIITTRESNKFLCTAYSLILAGAIGNLIDRFSLNYVVDFLDFYIGESHFPAFNIADSAITIAGAMLVIDFFITYKKEREMKGKNASDSL